MANELPIDTGVTLFAGKFTEAILNTCWQQGLDLKAATLTAIADASGAYLDVEAPPAMTATAASAVTVTEPAVTIPSSLAVSDIIAQFSSTQTTQLTLLADKFTAFRASFFPDEGALYNSAEDWLQAAIDNPTAALPAAVATQLLEEDRSRILADSTRAQTAAVDALAVRRYPLPPGVAAAAVVQIQQKAQEEISASSRKLTVASIDQLRFVIDNVMKLRASAMSAALDYIKSLSLGTESANKIVDEGYGAQSRLISAAASYYSARTSAQELAYKGAQFNATQTQDAAKANLGAEMGIIEAKLKSLLQEAQTLGQMATAMFNNLHANAGMTASFTESQQT